MIGTGVGCKQEIPTTEEVTKEETAKEPETSEEQQAKKVVTVWFHEHPPMITLVKELIVDYEKENPDVQIDFSYFPHADYETALLAGFASGEGPDLFDIGDWNIPAYYKKGLIAPIEYESFGFNSMDDLIESWLPGSLQGYDINGDIYGIPMEFNSFSLFINPDYFKEVGLDPEKDYPKTWDELADIAVKMKIVENGVWKREGFDLPYHDPIWTMITVNAFFAQAGARILSEDGTKCVLDSPEALKAFSTYVELATKSKTGTPDVGMSTPTEPNLDFASGELAMWLTGPWASPTFAGHPLENTYMVVPTPQMKDGVKDTASIYGWCWSVSSAAKSTSESWKFINFLSNHQERFLTEVGYVQPRLGWLDSEAAKNFKYLDVFLKDMEKGTYIERTVIFQEVASAMYKAMQRCVMEGQDVEKSLLEAKTEIESAL